jgi:hypothetical protein
MTADSEFVFVNKTAQSTSLSRSNGRERHQIFSRVQARPSHREPQCFIVVTAADIASAKPSSATRRGSRFHRKELSPTPSFPRELSPLYFDPFQALPVNMDRHMQRMLAYCE